MIAEKANVATGRRRKAHNRLKVIFSFHPVKRHTSVSQNLTKLGCVLSLAIERSYDGEFCSCVWVLCVFIISLVIKL